jgi:hypothetical protein
MNHNRSRYGPMAGESTPEIRLLQSFEASTILSTLDPLAGQFAHQGRR